MKNKGLLFLFFILMFMYALNVMTPLLSDDYFISFVWPEGVRINGILPEDAKRVSSFSDVLSSVKAYYFIWGGRLPGQTLMTLFAWWGKDYFNVVNSVMSVLLIMEIYWISHEGKFTFNFNYKYIALIFFALWSFNMVFVDTFLWLSGSCEYLWMMVLLLAFLMPYVQHYHGVSFNASEKGIFSIAMFLGGVIAGCSREMLICWIIVALAYWLLLCKKKEDLHTWQVSGLIGLFLGYFVLITAPGNYARLVADGQAENIFTNSRLLIYKIFFISVIFCFQLLLWHFNITFFIRHKLLQRIIKERCFLAYQNIKLAKISLLISVGTVFFLFVLKYSGARPSFVTLVFLIISATLLIRAAEKAKVQIISDKTMLFLKIAGLTYLVITMLVSVYWNFENWKYWTNVLQSIENKNLNKTKTVLEISPMPYPVLQNKAIIVINSIIDASSGIWCGAHVSVMTISEDEHRNANIIVSNYYDIKGIKMVKEKHTEY